MSRQQPGKPAPNIPASAGEDSPLERRLTLFDTTLLVIGGIIGTGVFFNTSDVAKIVHTPGLIMLVWVIGGCIALIGALSFAELGAMMPTVGGEYAFLREGIHPLIAFLYGWALLMIINSGALAAVSMKFAATLPAIIPNEALAAKLSSPLAIKLVGLAALWILAMVNYFGVKPGAIVQNIFTSGKLIALAVLIIFGLAIPRTSHFTLQPFATGGYEGNLLTAIGAALAPVLFAYGGWQNSTYTGGEVINPRKTLPRALFIGIFIVIAVYVSAAFVYLHVLPVSEVGATATLATDVAQKLMGDFGSRFVSTAIVVSTLGFIDLTILTCPRVFYAMAKDGYLIKPAAYLHPKYKSPVVILIIYVIWTSIYLLQGSYGELLSYTTFGDWIFFGLTVVTVFTLRYKYPNLLRPYKVLGYPVLPAIFVLIAFSFVVINFLSNRRNSTIGLGLILLGIPVFYLFRAINARYKEI
ncbi:MAG TPA: amino acid permease [Blastocatellia bacterium]|nr:amino acid permease [Blastocatellia bacterium]